MAQQHPSSTSSATPPILPRFEDALDLRPLPNGNDWLVLEPFHYDTAIPLSGAVPTVEVWDDRLTAWVRNWRITVPAGFTTDGASTPRAIWWLIPRTGKHLRAAVVHDYLYRTPHLARRPEADAVFYEAMKYPCQVGWFTRSAAWLGVRLGGRRAYKGSL